MKWQNIKARDLGILVNKLNLQGGKKKRTPHPVYWYCLDGKKHLRITLPNIHGGAGSVSIGFLKSIRNKLMLDNPQFVDLVQCPLTPEQYEGIIRGKLRL